MEFLYIFAVVFVVVFVLKMVFIRPSLLLAPLAIGLYSGFHDKLNSDFQLVALIAIIVLAIIPFMPKRKTPNV